jgi:hypothetical protein
MLLMRKSVEPKFTYNLRFFYDLFWLFLMVLPPGIPRSRIAKTKGYLHGPAMVVSKCLKWPPGLDAIILEAF